MPRLILCTQAWDPSGPVKSSSYPSAHPLVWNPTPLLANLYIPGYCVPYDDDLSPLLDLVSRSSDEALKVLGDFLWLLDVTGVSLSGGIPCILFVCLALGTFSDWQFQNSSRLFPGETHCQGGSKNIRAW
ncbi:hypothetical protein DSO57_1032875 [Entomophthora muscae]|uniref:Uncharacterized protein n=1 Tax=Entomophthora muscae TaxID=34485 RepID=A0ACC2U995_9FUNG|nr:hypothetical protein DSO57_1032875 [Entomophthora muscae]